MDDVALTTPAPGAPAAPPRKRRRLPRGAVVVGLLGLLMFLLGGFGGSYQGRLGEVQKNDNAAYLPATAESTRVSNEQQQFSPVQTIPGFLVYQRAGGLTAADKAEDRGGPRHRAPQLAGVAADAGARRRSSPRTGRRPASRCR